MKFTRHKYGNKTSSLCALNHSHRSKLESSVCAILSKDLQDELIGVEKHIYLTNARILYIPDFELRNRITGVISYAEAKGFPTPEWAIKKRLWKHYGPGRLQIWTGDHKCPRLEETIIPKTSTPPVDEL